MQTCEACYELVPSGAHYRKFYLATQLRAPNAAVKAI